MQARVKLGYFITPENLVLLLFNLPTPREINPSSDFYHHKWDFQAFVIL